MSSTEAPPEARETVAQHALDPDDEWVLLDMLGLL